MTGGQVTEEELFRFAWGFDIFWSDVAKDPALDEVEKKLRQVMEDRMWKRLAWQHDVQLDIRQTASGWVVELVFEFEGCEVDRRFMFATEQEAKAVADTLRAIMDIERPDSASL